MQNENIIAFIANREKRKGVLLSYLLFLSVFMCCAFIVLHIIIIHFDRPELEAHSKFNFEKLERLAFQSDRAIERLESSNVTECSPSELSIQSDLIRKYYFIGDIGRVKGNEVTCSLIAGHLSGIKAPLALQNNIDRPHVKSTGFEESKDLYSTFVVQKNDIVIFASQAFLGDLRSRQTFKNSIGSMIHSRDGEVFFYFGDIDKRDFNVNTEKVNSFSNYLPIYGKRLTLTRCSNYLDVCISSIDKKLGVFRVSETFALSFGAFSFVIGTIVFYFFTLLRTGTRGFASNIDWAIKREKIYNVYQPLFALEDGRQSGVEVLARWNSRKYGQVPPDIFISFCEAKGYIFDLTKVVISKAFAELADVLEATPSSTVSLNVSASVLTNKTFAHFLQSEVNKYDFTYSQVVLELTERNSTPEDSLIQSCKTLQNLGFKLSLDDFGTGHSNISWLTMLNPDEVKIDKMFTQAYGEKSPKGFAFEGIISILNEMTGPHVVFEGIETQKQLDSLINKLPNALGQGWLFAKPMTVSDYLLWLENRDAEN